MACIFHVNQDVNNAILKQDFCGRGVPSSDFKSRSFNCCDGMTLPVCNFVGVDAEKDDEKRENVPSTRSQSIVSTTGVWGLSPMFTIDPKCFHDGNVPQSQSRTVSLRLHPYCYLFQS